MAEHRMTREERERLPTLPLAVIGPRKKRPLPGDRAVVQRVKKYVKKLPKHPVGAPATRPLAALDTPTVQRMPRLFPNQRVGPSGRVTKPLPRAKVPKDRGTRSGLTRPLPARLLPAETRARRPRGGVAPRPPRIKPQPQSVVEADVRARRPVGAVETRVLGTPGSRGQRELMSGYTTQPLDKLPRVYRTPFWWNLYFERNKGKTTSRETLPHPILPRPSTPETRREAYANRPTRPLSIAAYPTRPLTPPGSSGPRAPARRAAPITAPITTPIEAVTGPSAAPATRPLSLAERARSTLDPRGTRSRTWAGISDIMASLRGAPASPPAAPPRPPTPPIGAPATQPLPRTTQPLGAPATQPLPGAPATQPVGPLTQRAQALLPYPPHAYTPGAGAGAGAPATVPVPPPTGAPVPPGQAPTVTAPTAYAQVQQQQAAARAQQRAQAGAPAQIARGLRSIVLPQSTRRSWLDGLIERIVSAPTPGGLALPLIGLMLFTSAVAPVGPQGETRFAMMLKALFGRVEVPDTPADIAAETIELTIQAARANPAIAATAGAAGTVGLLQPFLLSNEELWLATVGGAAPGA